MSGVAIVGCGYWGPNLIRNFSSLANCEIRMLCDLDEQRLTTVARAYPAARAVRDFQAVLDAPDVEAVAICTPLRTHFDLASAALRAGKHVLVEKPLAHSVRAAEELVTLAEAGGRVLMVDHTFVYAGAVRRIREILDQGSVGELLYVDSVRINLGLFQSDTNVIWDLAAHDVSIITHLVDCQPLRISATGSVHYGRLENLAYVTIQYEDALTAHLHVNWLAPVKLRRTLLGGSRQMVVYDDLEPSEKVRIYDKGVVVQEDPAVRDRARVDYRVGDMYAPYIDKTEPLESVCVAFLRAIQEGVAPPSDGPAGARVVRVLEAADRSVRKNGEWVTV